MTEINRSSAAKEHKDCRINKRPQPMRCKASIWARHYSRFCGILCSRGGTDLGYLTLSELKAFVMYMKHSASCSHVRGVFLANTQMHSGLPDQILLCCDMLSARRQQPKVALFKLKIQTSLEYKLKKSQKSIIFTIFALSNAVISRKHQIQLDNAILNT